MPKWVGVMKEDKIYGLNFELNPELGGGHILLRNLDDPSKYMSSEFAGIFVVNLVHTVSYCILKKLLSVYSACFCLFSCQSLAVFALSGQGLDLWC